MKMDLKLTADELMNVVDAVVNEADALGYDLCDDEMTTDMLTIVDAALSAMGIEIIEDTEEVDAFGVPVDYDSDFDEEEEAEDEAEDEEDAGVAALETLVYVKNGKRTISEATATMILNMFLQCMMADPRVPDDCKLEFARGAFLQFAKKHNLEEVEVEGE